MQDSHFPNDKAKAFARPTEEIFDNIIDEALRNDQNRYFIVRIELLKTLFEDLSRKPAFIQRAAIYPPLEFPDSPGLFHPQPKKKAQWKQQQSKFYSARPKKF